jgi:hypothetical protein
MIIFVTVSFKKKIATTCSCLYKLSDGLFRFVVRRLCKLSFCNDGAKHHHLNTNLKKIRKNEMEFGNVNDYYEFLLTT